MIRNFGTFCALGVMILFVGCVSSPRYTATKGAGTGDSGGSFMMDEEGIASYYGEEFEGRMTANGERFDPGDLTAAHKTLPFHTSVRVTNLTNGKSVTVRINDRGPFIEGRIIDLTTSAARKIGMIGTGTARVRIEVLELGQPGFKPR